MSLVKHTQNYTTMANKLINSGELSFGAVGMYVFINSKIDGWDFSYWRIAREKDTTEYEVEKLCKELKKLGLLAQTPKQTILENKKKQFNGYDWHLFDEIDTNRLITGGAKFSSPVEQKHSGYAVDINKPENNKPENNKPENQNFSTENFPEATKEDILSQPLDKKPTKQTNIKLSNKEVLENKINRWNNYQPSYDELNEIAINSMDYGVYKGKEVFFNQNQLTSLLDSCRNWWINKFQIEINEATEKKLNTTAKSNFTANPKTAFFNWINKLDKVKPSGKQPSPTSNPTTKNDTLIDLF